MDPHLHLARIYGHHPGAPLRPEALADVLRVLFDHQQAWLAGLLSFAPRTVKAVAERGGAPMGEVWYRLEKMAERRLVRQSRESRDSYSLLAPQDLWTLSLLTISDPEAKTRRVNLWQRAFEQPIGPPAPMNRILAAGLSSPSLEGSTEELISALENHPDPAVSPCPWNNGESNSERVCLWLGPMAQYYLDAGVARPIQTASAVDLIRSAAGRGSVVVAPNTLELQGRVCLCQPGTDGLPLSCGPASPAHSAWLISFSPALCDACGHCLKLCPVQAWTEGLSGLSFNPEACLGCGLCAAACPTGAAVLTRRPYFIPPPKTQNDLLSWAANLLSIPHSFTSSACD